MITPEPPAGSEHYREGWRHGYEQAAIDRERSADAVRLVPAGAEGDTPTAPAAGDVWHEALRRLDALAGVYTGYARIEEIRSWVERGGDGAAEAVDALTAAQAPESPTDSTPKAGRWGSGEAETATDTVQAREPDDATIARAFPAAEALAEAWWAPRHPGVGWADLPATVRDDYVQTAREWINAAQAVAGPSTDTVQAPDVAAERQARYQETACARRPAEERPDA